MSTRLLESDGSLTDADLVRQTRGGQASAYEVLVHRWSARVLAFVRARVHRGDVAEDLAQEALLRGYRSIQSLSDTTKFGPWLLSIAHRLTIDWLKSKSRTEVPFVDLYANQDRHEVGNRWRTEVDVPVEACSRKEQRDILIRLVDELPEPLREVLLIYYYDGATYKELSQMLGVSTATINARLTKARKMLRKKCRQCGVNDEV